MSLTSDRAASAPRYLALSPKQRLGSLVLAAGAALASAIPAQPPAGALTIDLTAPGALRPRNVALESVTYRGQRAVRVTELPSAAGAAVAVVVGSDFGDGTIEVEIASEPAPGAPEGSRGFAGLAFRLADDGFEAIYLRPTNGRADDQLRRNHSVQYVSEPGHPWYKLREETPGLYESYVDLEPGVWTKVRIVVEGARAQLYVHDAPQPCLIVKDLKRGAGARGAVALWIGQGTVAHFRALEIRPR
jgi:hypothetical protein